MTTTLLEVLVLSILLGAGFKLGVRLTEFVLAEIFNPLLFKLGARRGL